MGDKTAIEWTDSSWNPVVGCAYVSDGCRGCYAARDAFGRLSKNPLYAGLAERRTPDELPRFTGEVRMVPERLEQPLHWKRPRRIFVNSMSDLFHPDLLGVGLKRDGAERPYLAEIMAVMVRASHHTFQVLTKRPNIMRAVLSDPMFKLEVNAILLRDGHEVMPGGMSEPETPWPKHLWFGTSVENQRYADIRIPHLLRTPAAIRFLSVEPLLGPVDIGRFLGPDLHWVIVGGESGPKSRPMHLDWVRSIRDQCEAAPVPFLFKQWGEWVPAKNGEDPPGPRHEFPGTTDSGLFYAPSGYSVRVGKKAAGRELDGRTWDEYPA